MTQTLKFVLLNAPIIIGGKNFQHKLDPKAVKGLLIDYDHKEKELVVKFNSEVARIPQAGISHRIYAEVVDEPIARQPGAGGGVKAQVSTPVGHVHEGPGAGKTGLESNGVRL